VRVRVPSRDQSCYLVCPGCLQRCAFGWAVGIVAASAGRMSRAMRCQTASVYLHSSSTARDISAKARRVATNSTAKEPSSATNAARSLLV
jgi:hypothetical protein